MNTIGLDIGTTSIAAVCLNEKENLVAVQTIENTSHISGEAFSDLCSADAIVEICRQRIDAMRLYGDIKSIGISCQMHGILYVNADGKAVSPLYTWQDARGNETLADGETYAERLQRLTGHTFASGYGIVTHYYNSKNHLVPKDAVKLCSIGDYVAMCLTGRTSPLLHPTIAHSLGAFLMKENRFDADALQKARIDSMILPEVAMRECVIGTTPDGMAVCAAIGDHPAGVFASRDGENDIHINIGTSAQISLVTRGVLDTKRMESRPYLSGKYLLVGASLCGGSAYRMLCDFYVATAKMLGCAAPQNVYAMMDAAGEMADSDLIFDTRFRGTRQDPTVRGSITGISDTNFTPQNLIAALQNGICRELYDCFCTIPGGIVKNREILVTGNALKKNPVFCRRLSSLFSMPVSFSETEEGAATGAARSAMCTVI